MGRNSGLPAGYERFRVSAQHVPDDSGCGLLHVDMDAFFAAVELRTRPELVDKPVVVAGSGPRSVVTSANYPAREYGVRAAMPAAVARRLCPQAVFIPPTHGLYGEVSRGVMAIFRDLTPLVEPMSLDEAFLDVSGALRRLKATPVELAAGIRRRVRAEHGITCSVGVAGVKFVAKLASGMAKPDGVLVVPVEQTLAFLHPLPISALWGVGQRTEESLRRLGLTTIAEVAAAPLPRLRRAVGNAAAEHLYALAHGQDERGVVVDSPDKSIGAEHTFDTDQRDPRLLERELLRLSERVAASLRAREVRGRTVSIKVRFADFRTITRARTLASATDVARVIHSTAVALLTEAVSGAEIRLLGVRVEGLSGADAPEQLTFERAEPRWRDAEVAADVARSKFGAGAVRPASLLSPGPGEPRRHSPT
ncbi:DNA polymerase IV [Amycolatopsis acidiphila]|uniref:DNA polymerase IV n=1 Tax=Amycolatopsis acidiphila TaxID=715473 RepID=A0A557ZY92_9PSEU|nr:DNA polymerase IV [Amycolatopsis acidiphila]TVT16970.1 DNA polymerase IV [Amycolatopsis acidiphila]UIJ62138.1 DNA polymerase IV [Amycolatopsis acidiphila]GHG92054.1 DNA polymerase IV [Amycolatopsis acidiphila]